MLGGEKSRARNRMVVRPYVASEIRNSTVEMVLMPGKVTERMEGKRRRMRAKKAREVGRENLK